MPNTPENDPSKSLTNVGANASSRPRETSSSGAQRAGASPQSSRGRGSVRLDRRTIEALRRPTGGGFQVVRELNLFELFGIFKRQIWIVILATVVGMAVAGYYSQTVTPRYAASSSVYIPEMNSMSMLNTLSRTNFSTMQNLRGDTIQTHALIIKSYEIMSKTWKSIVSDPDTRAMLKTKAIDPNNPNNELLTEAEYVGALTEMISIRVGGEQRGFNETNTITISCQSEDPEEAAMIVNTVVEQYKLHFSDKYTQNNNEVRLAIEESQKAIATEIESKKQALFDYIQNSPTSFIGSDENNPLLTSLIGMSEKMVEIDFQKLRLENQLSALENAVAGREIEDINDAELIELMGGGDSESILTTISSIARGNAYDTTVRASEVSLTKNAMAQKIQDLKLQLLDQLQIYGEGHTKVVALKQQIDDLEKQAKDIEDNANTRGMIGVVSYAELFKSYQGALKRRLSQLIEEKNKIADYVAERDGEVREITQYRETIDTMKISIESSKQMLEHLDQNLKQLSLMSDVISYQIGRAHV